MGKWLYFLVFFASGVGEACTAEWENQKPFFDPLFYKTKVATVLEFGTGPSTEYFFKNTDRLVSMELMTAASAQQTKQKLKEYCCRC